MTGRADAEALLRRMLGEHARFRDGQWEAIDRVANRRQRVLVVQRTGWGKSVVYFLATKLLRDAGAGPTLLISPLLALMRNQIAMAERLGIRAVTIHSQNPDDWPATETALRENRCDVLLISPERLANQEFLQRLLPLMQGQIGLFVVDEAHCISDWGHDFRPDYRRIVRVLRSLPAGVPVLCTTATANDRVVADVLKQIPQLEAVRGPLTRSSLKLFNIRLDDQAERLAWLAQTLPQLPGSGIVYCLTIADARRAGGGLGVRHIAERARGRRHCGLFHPHGVSAGGDDVGSVARVGEQRRDDRGGDWRGVERATGHGREGAEVVGGGQRRHPRTHPVRPHAESVDARRDARRRSDRVASCRGGTDAPLRRAYRLSDGISGARIG
jgi:hypothetical protein